MQDVEEPNLLPRVRNCYDVDQPVENRKPNHQVPDRQVYIRFLGVKL